MARDTFSHTEADAGEWERYFGDAPDDDRPTAAELAEDAAWDANRPFVPLEGISLEPPF